MKPTWTCPASVDGLLIFALAYYAAAILRS